MVAKQYSSLEADGAGLKGQATELGETSVLKISLLCASRVSAQPAKSADYLLKIYIWHCGSKVQVLNEEALC